MCGIAGSFAYLGGAVDQEELVRVRDAMRTRGPDGEGLWVGEQGSVALAHRRLSILDLTDAGAQPMVRGPLAIVFNGEIYNFRMLRRELESKGHGFQSGSDTEVLLAMWSEYGTAMFPRLRGMFALALWDSRDRRLLLARDGLGIKPLYWANEGGVVRFASQVRALAQAQVDTGPEPAGHAGFLLWGSVPEPWTLYRGIHALPAGAWMEVSGQGIGEPQAFFQLSKILRGDIARDLSAGDALASICEALSGSVRAHLESDVPVGVFLSAGLDSTLIAALASGCSASITTTTLGFDSLRATPGDECALAEEVARSLGTFHQTHWVTRDDFLSARQRILADMDQPSIDGVNTWFVARAAARQGLKVALSGLGGDELLASYPSFRDVPRIVARLGPWSRVPGLGLGFRHLTAPMFKRLAKPKFAGLIEYGGDIGGAYLLRRGLFMPWELPSILDPDMARAGWERLHTRAALAQSTYGVTPGRLEISALEMSWYMRNQLLRDADWAGMAHSVEIRVPLVDAELLSQAVPAIAAQPALTKPEVVRAAAPCLPLSLFDRPKTGFSVPVHQWITGQSDRGGAGMRHWARQVYREFTQGPGE